MNSIAQTAVPAEAPQSRFLSGPAIVLYIAGAKLLLHLLMVARYGIFRDEMYYLACSRHMAWGYVDHPPFTVWIAWFSRMVLGDSPLGVRLLPILAGAAVVWLAAALAMAARGMKNRSRCPGRTNARYGFRKRPSPDARQRRRCAGCGRSRTQIEPLESTLLRCGVSSPVLP